MAMGQNPVPPVNIPIPTIIGSKMGGAPTPKWDPISLDRPYLKTPSARLWSQKKAAAQTAAEVAPGRGAPSHGSASAPPSDAAGPR